MKIPLSRTERIVTAYAEPAAGPGWANTPLWVIIEDGATGKVRQVCLQPSEQTAEMHTLYGFSSLAHSQMMGAVKRVVKQNRKGLTPPLNSKPKKTARVKPLHCGPMPHLKN